MSFVAKTLRSNRFKLITDAQNLINGENVDGATMETFDSMMAEADQLLAQITRVEKAATEATKIEEIVGASAEKTGMSIGATINEVDRFKQGFVAHLRASNNIVLDAKGKVALDDYRAAASLTGSAGGYTVPLELMREIYAALILEGGVRSAARILQTAQGNNIDVPLNDDTSNVASIVFENSSLGTATDLVFAKTTLTAYKFTSGVALVSRELLQDSAFNFFDDFLQQQLIHRFSRGTNAFYTSGTGSNQPLGCLSAATSGTVGATGQTTSVIYNDLVNLEHSLPVPYRRNAKWMMGDNAFRAIKRLVDTVGRPLWLPNITANAPDTLLGYPIVLNADMPVMAANAKSILFGDFSNFVIRDTLDLSFQVLNELYAASGQVGVVGLMRTDSRLITAGQALKYYANSSS